MSPKTDKARCNIPRCSAIGDHRKLWISQRCFQRETETSNSERMTLLPRCCDNEG